MKRVNQSEYSKLLEQYHKDSLVTSKNFYSIIAKIRNDIKYLNPLIYTADELITRDVIVL